MMGESYASFWDLTLREYVRVSGAIQRRKRDEIQRARVLNQELAHLLAFAFNDPKNIPDLTKDQGGGAELSEAQQAEQSDALLKAFAAAHNASRSGAKKMVKI